MVDDWKSAPLGELLRQSEETIEVDLTENYQQITVRMWGNGVVSRGWVIGDELGSSRWYVAHQGQFILSKIDARHGAFGLVPPELEGAIVSNDFPLFDIDASKALPQYLYWLSRTHDFVDLCKRASEGTTNRVRLKLDRFLATEISLPPLDEQWRIVAHIDALAEQIAAARGLRQGAVEQANAAWVSSLNTAFLALYTLKHVDPQAMLGEYAKKHANSPQYKHNNASPQNPRIYSEGLFALPDGWVWSDLGSVLTHIVDCVNDTPNFASDPTGYIGLKSTNIRPYSLELSQIWYVSQEDFNHWNRREQPQGGDVIITREAPLGNACILPDRNDLCLTQRLLLLRCDGEYVSNRFILHYLNSPMFLNQVKELSRGLTHPHLRVGDTPRLLIPISIRSEQDRIVAYLDDIQVALTHIEQLQADTAAELDVLLPSLLDRAFRGEL